MVALLIFIAVIAVIIVVSIFIRNIIRNTKYKNSPKAKDVPIKTLEEITGSKLYEAKDENTKLEVKNLKISFRTQSGILKAVRDISFDLHKGETFAIVGESGSGKSVTSKAIIGILSGNSIVEGGEILYDGQDLLKISEEDYHKIRGDKIAMIFQDPMSSLNPIMRVGQQLTEAMILKAKTSKKNARHAFNTMLKRLQNNIDKYYIADPNYNKKSTADIINIFDSFCIENTRIESVYNDAYTATCELEFTIENILFLLSRKQKVNLPKEVKSVLKELNKCYHEYVLIPNSQIGQIVDTLTIQASLGIQMDIQTVVNALADLKDILHQVTLQDKPNFFTLSFYKLFNKDADLSHLSVKELNEMTLRYLNENFMFEFIKLAEKGVYNSHKFSINVKKELLEKALSDLEYFSKGDFDKSLAETRIKETAKIVDVAIDRLVIKKNSTEYVFKSAALSYLKRYVEGVISNPIELDKYNKQKAKYDSLIEKGKTPDWTLNPLVQVDLDLTLNNLRKVYEDLICSLYNDIANDESFDVNKHVIDIIDFLKEQASLAVSKMTNKIAKAKAIKLMEEVGIPEPAIRFNQYPFEFSGGMRQRIVIAIALSANPDILICDEPTTALDVTIQSQILELINVIKKERNLSVIFITHNLGVVANMADRIAVMYAGKIVEYGTSEEVFYDPRHPYTWALLSSMPDLHTRDRLDSIPGTPPNMIYPPKGDAFAARNKYALKIDFEMQPPLFKVSDTHYAATWLLHPDAPKVELPKIITDRIERLKKEMEKDGRY